MRILYVEDDDAVRTTVVQALGVIFRRLGIKTEVDAVDSYKAAVSALEASFVKNKPYDGILSDFNYSGEADDGRHNKNGRGGLDLAGYIAGKNIQIPLAYLTGERDAAIRELDGQVAAENILAKPFSVKSLQECLLRMMPSLVTDRSPQVKTCGTLDA